MIDLRAVRRYSKALYEMSERAGTSDAIDDQFVAFKELAAKHHEISNLLSNSTISLAEKEDFVSKIVPQGTNLLLVNFLKVLVKKKRFAELRWIQEEFHRLYEKQRRVEEVTAISAVPLSEANRARLEEMLAAKLKSDIRLVTKTDPKMIGGLVIRFAGHEINAGFRSRLESIAQLLA